MRQATQTWVPTSTLDIPRIRSLMTAISQFKIQMIKMLVAALKGKPVPLLTGKVSLLGFHSRTQASSWGTHCGLASTCPGARTQSVLKDLLRARRSFGKSTHQSPN